ncbi:bifunctional aminoglycoside phosphotransferase/ATP-binding protein [Phenylobacterium sp. J367]|uniref:bifunctional aminoglycoside phosphotransferase/ATP-binding protein n=1 Tax=Phenylobacterium sp. J367 TaxID=2898435 RepID=UPI0021508A93|nr:bifunctional aminoglycoside phosphotransferase/ATP-binding protein [Phenylobacterium sp. J367]MCR5878785.1 AAA family ATPase [Phenylobacterium sp. J367]
MGAEHEAEVVRWLAARTSAPIETAISRVFLGTDVAYKLKRHVSLSYVEFGTPERRHWALERELSFNARTCDIYRRLVPITRAADGGLEWDGAGEVVDYALEMRRFDDAAVLAKTPQAVDGALAERLGRTIAGFHLQAPLKPEGGLTALAFTIGSNAQLLRELAPELGTERVEALVEATEAELERQAPLLARRSATGFARQCHGDLHLGNILVEGGEPVLFDCIEFNDLLSDIDVQYDLAFLLMDLDFRDRRDAAVRVHSAYLDEAARGFPPALWEGLAALPLMLSVRAGVRAHVSVHSGDVETARRYVDAGIAHLSPPPPRLLAVGGLSGSGKSTFGRAVAGRIGASPGAVVLRTDEIRKRLLNIPPTQPLGREHYTPAAQGQVYDAMIADARAMLAAGRSVVLDASFMDGGLRDRVAQLARDAGVPFDGVWLDAPAHVLEARVAARTGDASDANVDVLRGQLERAGDLEVEWTHVDASGDTREAAHAWLANEAQE